MNYWLVKTEPEEYSIDDLCRDKVTSWEGIRNYAARNNLRQMKQGDLVLVYHSSTKPTGAAGIAKITKEAYPDPEQWNPQSSYFDPKSPTEDPRWDRVDMAFVEKFPSIVSLEEIKKIRSLKEMVLIKRARLSVQPVSEAEFETLRSLAQRGN